MLDLAQLLPHSKKDSKLDTKTDRGVINEVAEVKVGLLLYMVLACGVLFVLLKLFKQNCHDNNHVQRVALLLCLAADGFISAILWTSVSNSTGCHSESSRLYREERLVAEQLLLDEQPNNGTRSRAAAAWSFSRRGSTRTCICGSQRHPMAPPSSFMSSTVDSSSVW